MAIGAFSRMGQIKKKMIVIRALNFKFKAINKMKKPIYSNYNKLSIFFGY